MITRLTIGNYMIDGYVESYDLANGRFRIEGTLVSDRLEYADTIKTIPIDFLKPPLSQEPVKEYTNPILELEV